MGKRRNLFIPVIVVILLIAVAFWLIKLKPTDTASSDVDEMVQRVENALGDDFKKQSKTEVAATLVYGNGKKEENINYHILKTTYYEADPNEITGLNVDALNVLFNPESANSCEQMKIQDWDAALYKTKSRGYLIMHNAARLTLPEDLSKKKSGTPMSAAAPKQMSCRFVKLKNTLDFTLVRSRGTGIYAAKQTPPLC